MDNPEINKEINNILSHLALRKPDLEDKCLKQAIEDLKATASLNDKKSNFKKLNALKMLNSLLNNDKNMDKFLQSNVLTS